MGSKQNIAVAGQILRDKVFVFLMINAALVIVAYGLNTFTGGTSTSIMTAIKNFVLVISIVHLWATNKPSSRHQADISIILMLLIFFILFSCLVSSDSFSSFIFALKFLIPLLYIYFATRNLLSKHSARVVIMGLVYWFLFIYSIPQISFLISGGTLTEMNIYGLSEDTGGSFYSNHYGWASVLFIALALIILSQFKLPPLMWIYVVTLLLLSLYLLVVSANRTSWLCFALILAFLLFRPNKLKIAYKMLILLTSVVVISTVLNAENSALSFIMEKNERQLDEGEPRFIVAQHMFSLFEQNTIYWMTGVGINNHEYLEGQLLNGYHNTYYEILFGTGILGFLLFIFLFIWKPVSVYNKMGTVLILTFPLVIIPFFENNLTAGQFVFFPWLIFSCVAIILSTHKIQTYSA